MCGVLILDVYYSDYLGLDLMLDVYYSDYPGLDPISHW